MSQGVSLSAAPPPRVAPTFLRAFAAWSVLHTPQPDSLVNPQVLPPEQQHQQQQGQVAAGR